MRRNPKTPAPRFTAAPAAAAIAAASASALAGAVACGEAAENAADMPEFRVMDQALGNGRLPNNFPFLNQARRPPSAPRASSI